MTSVWGYKLDTASPPPPSFSPFLQLTFGFFLTPLFLCFASFSSSLIEGRSDFLVVQRTSKGGVDAP